MQHFFTTMQLVFSTTWWWPSLTSAGLQISWLRVVLDEGHFVKNVGTQQSRAATALAARARWVVSGTPIQNSMKDLFGIVKFLHLAPLSERSVFRSSMERPMAIGDSSAMLKLKVLSPDCSPTWYCLIPGGRSGGCC